MAPDRGLRLGDDGGEERGFRSEERRGPGDLVAAPRPPTRSLPPPIEGQHFTVRGIAVGLTVGLLICFSNMYFGLQTGWVSTMTMPSSLLGFGIFRVLMRHLRFPFSPVENVLVQTVAGSMAIMPLGCGFVGVVPAMNYLLTPEEQGPVTLGTGKLLIWSLGLCYFGVLFAVPLRRQVIIRERLKFPSGFSTAVLIGVLHGKAMPSNGAQDTNNAASGTFASLVPHADEPSSEGTWRPEFIDDSDGIGNGARTPLLEAAGGALSDEWAMNVRILLTSFALSGFYTLCTFFLPSLRSIPILGYQAAATWLWTLNPSPAYVGQGIIMGPETTLHMFIGAIIGWAVLSPLAKGAGWAPGPVGDWESGSKGWIVWVSLAIMLADAVVSLGHLLLQTIWRQHGLGQKMPDGATFRSLLRRLSLGSRRDPGYVALHTDEQYGADITQPSGDHANEERNIPHGELDDTHEADNEPHDAPPEQQVSNRVVVVGLLLSIVLCVGAVHAVFGELVPLYANVLAVFLALLLSVMGVRALGETDLNPVSGISKLAQLFFAFIIPQGHRAGVLINLVAGAVSEAGALQAGELMQDLKTGHLLGAAPKAQFWGQVIGATAGAVASAFVYKLYTSVYTIPGDLFPVPTGYVWIFTARLVTGDGLPPHARTWAQGFGVVFAVLTLMRIYMGGANGSAANTRWASLRPLIPGGIAVAVGMYNVPSFTLARTVGGLVSWHWRRRQWSDTSLIVIASGFILGEGVVSILNLVLESFKVPHL